MANWDLTEGLKNLRAQMNARFPHRDKKSDGTIGDAAHQAETSGHNPDDTVGSRPEWDGDADANAEVRAWDMDSDLGEPGVTDQMVVDHLRALPGLSSVLRYMIYNRKIYRVSNGWKAGAYSGASAHTEHIHFSGAYTQAADNNTTFDYRLDEIGDTVSVAEVREGALFFWQQAARGTSIPTNSTDPNDPYARAARTAVDKIIDWSGIASPIMDAVKSLTALVMSQSNVTADELVAALEPVLEAKLEGAATPDDVERVLRTVFGSLKPAAS